MCRRKGSDSFLLVALALAGACGSCGGRSDGEKRKPIAPAPGGPPSFAALAERLLPSVVIVVEAGDGPTETGRAPVPLETGSLGAGFVVDARGHVLTNRHVVGAAQRLWVRTADGETHSARLVGQDDQTDLALLLVDSRGKPLSPVAMGDSDTLAVGDWVVAVGSPFGMGHSLTAGIVSAKGQRDFVEFPGVSDFIQTDAAINPGNSGGPLVDAQGRVVGINTVMRTDAQGIGFAIPVRVIQEVLPGLIRDGKIGRSWIGLFVEPVAHRDAADAAQGGALVSELVEGGPAERADVRTGDVILTFDGHKVARAEDLRRLVFAATVGKSVVMRIRRHGSERDIGIKTITRPGDAP